MPKSKKSGRGRAASSGAAPATTNAADAPKLLAAPGRAALLKAKALALRDRIFAWPATRAAAMRAQGKRFGKAVRARVRAMKKRGKDARAAVIRFFRSDAFRHGAQRAAVLSGTAVGVLLVAAIAFSSYSYALERRFLPNTTIAGESVGWLTRQEALDALRTRVTALERRGIVYDVEGKAYTLTPADLGIVIDAEATVNRAFDDGHDGLFLDRQERRLKALVSRHDTPPATSFTSEAVSAQLRKSIPEIADRPMNPTVRWNGRAFEVVPGKAANTTDFSALLAATESAIRDLEARRVPVQLTVAQPSIPDAAAEAAMAEAEILRKRTLQFTSAKNGGPWTVSFTKDPTWIAFVEMPPTLDARIDATRLEGYFTDKVAPEIFQEHEDATIARTDEKSWRVQVDGKAQDGLVLDVPKALAMATDAVEQGHGTVDLPVNVEPGRVLGEDGRDLGLKDLLSNGVSDFSGSPAGRDFNVRKGMGIYNGILIPQGASFSFNDFLGPVDGRHGWKDALTIFNGGAETRMEPGGGICQVSTTVYRAAVEAGLPIVERRAHSYFVSYYAKLGGLGVDATIYPGVQDLVFTNDTPGPILMLASTSGTRASVKLYGTKDRNVELAGPYRKGTVSSANSFSVTWQQTIAFNDGTQKKNTIFSSYRPAGGPPKPVTPPAPTTAAAPSAPPVVPAEAPAAPASGASEMPLLQ